MVDGKDMGKVIYIGKPPATASSDAAATLMYADVVAVWSMRAACRFICEVSTLVGLGGPVWSNGCVYVCVCAAPSPQFCGMLLPRGSIVERGKANITNW